MLKAALICVCVSGTVSSANDQYSPPADYYEDVAGTGAILKGTLYDAIQISFNQQSSYGDFRNSAALHDMNPSNPSRILLAYNRSSVSGTWNSGSTWNREHVWPVSRQPGSASNSSRGNLGDPHALRPCTPNVNSSRGNKPFGTSTSSGSFGHAGSFYFPGDTDKGDIARSLMYSDTRYGPETGIALVNGVPSGNQMGDLTALVHWHFSDVPDEFERRRNHVIFSQAENPQYYTGNRNPYIDHPEYVWSVYVDQSNDSQITLQNAQHIGGGASQLDVIDSVFTGAAAGGVINTVIQKQGTDGTYFSVTSTGDVSASLDGKYNAFPVLASGNADSVPLAITVDAPTTNPGLYEGTVVINNLDVTTQGGAGRGANDGDDTLVISRRVVDRAVPSLAQNATLIASSLDLGDLVRGVDEEADDEFTVYNLESTAGFTAALDISTSLLPVGAPVDVSTLAGTQVLAGQGVDIGVTVDATGLVPGAYQAAVFIHSTDDATISGFQPKDDLIMAVSFEVVPCEGDVQSDASAVDGLVDISDLLSVLANFNENHATPWFDGDANGDGVTDISDLLIVLQNFDSSCL